jgi:hypothetical protein
MTGITLFQGITLAVAVLGAVLGLINTWHNLDKSRVKLIVRPKHAIPVGAADPNIRFCIEVTNLSAFPVTVYDVGVFYRGSDNRGSLANPILIDGGGWPRRLEPRTAVSVYCRSLQQPGHIIRCAYARTECGHTETGTSGALEQIARGELQEA